MSIETAFDPAKEEYINLATFRRDGRIVRTPVWVAGHDNCWYVFSESKAGKVKRINNNGKMMIAACDSRGNVSSDWIEGKARIVTDRSEIDSMYRAFDQKYRWKIRLLNFFARLSGRYGKRAVIALTPGQFPA